MKNVIFYLAFLFISGCAVSKPPEDTIPIFNTRDNNALTAVATIFNEDKETYESGGKSLIEWDKVKLESNKITKDDIVSLIIGSNELPLDESSLHFYNIYYLLRDVNLIDSCELSANCVLGALESGASSMLKDGDHKFLESYRADNKKFKFKHYDPEKIKPFMHEIATGLVKMKEDREKQENEENSKFPDTEPFKFKYTNDEYANAALKLINNAKLEDHNLRDLKGNKTKAYGKPTIYGKPFIIKLYTYPRALLNQVKECEKASAYVNTDIDNLCKRAVVTGVRDWIDTARNPSISESAWRAAASDAIIFRGALRDVDIMFSHWAGMARVYQKNLNETGRLSL
ncbi:hypothetical protein [Xenorhabdus bovienii]|uniref:Lipoprotein n=1 Tax=Xenorhabdus bovienii TaxID=40576 RepID=A0A0B6X9D4_XENBV|nr:hypothetical protein [Xenorhabdus bovienii]CDG86632.1 exported hypothetical protein [Xenorhabdus bovienii str. feltiae France]CDG90720.1 exported hypothetical protein [Xenorhabdus bovienii str. feltiae Florida]CDM90190.1 exported protein of unknown function [Xenorhabdus bovienii]